MCVRYCSIATNGSACGRACSICCRGLPSRTGLWNATGQRALAALPLSIHAADRRTALQTLYATLNDHIHQLDAQLVDCVATRAGAQRLMTHPGVGVITALATDVFLGDPTRFASGKAVASYIGLIPREYSSGARQRLGAVSKQGNSFVRFLWGEAAVQAARRDPALQRFFRRKAVQKGIGKARVAAARKLGIRLWIMLRDQIDYVEFCRRAAAPSVRRQTHAGMPEANDGPR